MYPQMKQRRRILVLWSVLGLLAAALLYAVYEPLWVAWRCYQLHEGGEHVAAEVVGKDPELGLILQVTEGSQAGNACTADASAAHYEAAEPGDRLAVVVRPEVPGECTLESTLSASLVLLWALSAGVGFALLLLVSIGAWIHRGLVAAPRLTSHLGLEPKDVKYPLRHPLAPPRPAHRPAPRAERHARHRRLEGPTVPARLPLRSVSHRDLRVRLPRHISQADLNASSAP
jgi:hypothetical protein